MDAGFTPEAFAGFTPDVDAGFTPEVDAGFTPEVSRVTSLNKSWRDCLSAQLPRTPMMLLASQCVKPHLDVRL